jgi:adenosine deaminase
VPIDRPVSIDNSFPLIDLHRHLDGNVRLETILDLGIKFNLPLPAFHLEGLRPHVQITEPAPGVMAFIDKFKWMVGVLCDYESCQRIAYENVEDAYIEGIDYIELRFSPTFMAESNNLDLFGVVEAVVDGVRKGKRDHGIGVNLIGIISRTYGIDLGWEELNALLSEKDHLVGLDLAGDEVNFPASLFIEHFKKGRDAGWQITAHAGESAGPESVWQAVDELGASRLGHAVRAIEDDRLIDTLSERRIGIETSLTSNLQTMTVPDLAIHPAKQFLEKGMLVTLNTDDPGISAIDLVHEYTIAAPAAGLTHDQVHQAQRNALEIAFLPDFEKQALLEQKYKEVPSDRDFDDML